MAFAEVITGRAIGTGFWSGYGKYVGNDGAIVSYLSGHSIPVTPIIWVFAAGALYLALRDARKEGPKAIGFPLGLLFVLFSFMFSRGFAVFLLYSAIIVAGIFVFLRAKDLSQKGFLGALTLLVGVSYFLTGNLLLLPIMGGICAIILWVVKRAIKKKEHGSAAERKALQAAGYDIGGEDKIIRKEHHAENQADRAGDLGKVTEDAAEVEERNAELEIHAAALSAGADEIGKKLTALDKAEEGAENRDMKVLEFAQAVDRHIKEHAMENEDDAKKTADLKADAKRLVMVIGELVNDEKFADKYRKSTMDAIMDTEEMMVEAAENAKAVLASEIRLEKDLRPKANKGFAVIEKELKSKEEAVEKLFKKYKGSSGAEKQALEKELGSLEQQRDILRHSVSEIAELRSKVFDVLTKGKKILKMMKGEANRVVDSEKKIAAFSDNMEKLEGHIGQNIELLGDAFRTFQSDMAGLDKEALPEEVLVKASKNVGVIFDKTKTFISDTEQFNRNEVLPFIMANSDLLKSCWRIENAADFANKVSTQVSKALENLAKMAEAANAGNHEEVKNAKNLVEIDEFQAKISNYADWKQNKIKAQVKKTYGDLSEAVKSVNAQIAYLVREKAVLEDTEKKTLDALSSGMAALTEIRQRQAQQFQQAAQQAQADLAKAKKFERKEKAAA